MPIIQTVKWRIGDPSMRMSQQEKDRSHERIVDSAARIVRQRGVDGASVSDVMQDAGLTHGGFYKHFRSKDDLLVAAIERAFNDISQGKLPGHDENRDISPADFAALYLSDGHVASPAIGCPIAALSGDVGRSSIKLRARFGAGVRRVIAMLAGKTWGPASSLEVGATRQLAMMAGAVMIARASDPDTAREVLAACRLTPD